MHVVDPQTGLPTEAPAPTNPLGEVLSTQPGQLAWYRQRLSQLAAKESRTPAEERDMATYSAHLAMWDRAPASIAPKQKIAALKRQYAQAVLMGDTRLAVTLDGQIATARAEEKAAREARRAAPAREAIREAAARKAREEIEAAEAARAARQAEVDAAADELAAALVNVARIYSTLPRRFPSNLDQVTGTAQQLALKQGALVRVDPRGSIAIGLNPNIEGGK